MSGKRKYLSFAMLAIFSLIAFLSVSTVFGQTNPPDPSTSNTPAISEQNTVTSIVMGFIPVLVPLLIAAKKKIMELLSMPKFPSWILPILAVALGELLNWIASLSGHGAGPLLAALLGMAGIGVRELIDQVKVRIADGPKLSSAIVIFGLSTTLFAAGCAGKLQNGGDYAPGTNAVTMDASGGSVTNFVPSQMPDYQFFVVDSAFDFAYSTVDAAFNFERDNRALLWQISPSIKHALDNIRPTANQARVAYSQARKTYLMNPTPANLSTLQTWLAKIQAVSEAAQTAIAPASKSKKVIVPKSK